MIVLMTKIIFHNRHKVSKKLREKRGGGACQGRGEAPKQPAGPRFERPARAV